MGRALALAERKSGAMSGETEHPIVNESGTPLIRSHDLLAEVADMLGFEYDEQLPTNCLNPECWTEQFIRSVEKELANGTFC